jgi:hypothetical protein
MLARFLDLEGPLRAVLPQWHAELGATCMPHSDGIRRLRALEKILLDFADFTREVEGDHLCMPKVAPLYDALLNKLRKLNVDPEAGQSASFFAGRFASALEHHLGDLLTSPNPALYAAALHPAHGHLRFVTLSVRDAVWAKLADIDGHVNASRKEGIFLGNALHIARADLLRQIRAHFENNAADPSLDLIGWWKDTAGEQVKPLWPLIQRVLCVPASSASAERLFSSLKFLNDEGGHTMISTLADLATIRETMKLDDTSFAQLMNMIVSYEAARVAK